MPRHTTLFLVVLIVGLALTVLGFFLSAPIGAPNSPDISSPRMEYAPLVFVIGVFLVFTSAVVYELVRDKE
jgi:hypothetical protein